MAGELGFDTGPYVNIATFCEKALQEVDGSLSLIRVMDQINVQAAGAEAPAEIPVGTVVQTTLVVALKPGEARGSLPFSVELEMPSGQRRQGPQMSIPFTGGPNQGVNIVLPIVMQIEELGLWWANVAVNGRLVTRVPLQINYQYLRGPTPTAG